MADIRFRNYGLITYHSEEVVKMVLQVHAKRIRHWAYILHDKDTYEHDVYEKDEKGNTTANLLHRKGDIKEKHFHLLLCMNNAMSLAAVRNLFPTGANTLGQGIRDKSDCFNYLNHKDKPEKYQYPDEAIICDNPDYWKSIQGGEDDDRTINILDDIISGVGFRELAKRYGRDLVVNYHKYWEFAKAVERTERADIEKLPEGMTSENVNVHDETIFENVHPETGEILADFEIESPIPYK